jgi:prolipoprotein diacylglyceryltransferase
VYTWWLGLCLLLILYGVIRFVVAEFRRESNTYLHILWVPGAGLLYAFGILLYVWLMLRA